MIAFLRKDPDPRHRRLPALSSGDRHRRHVGGMNLKTVKLASTRYLDGLPTSGSEDGHAFRDLEMEEESPQG
jgi:hypothetical protein